MSRTSCPEVLEEAAGVKIVTSSPEEDTSVLAAGRIFFKMQRINETSDHSFGFHLTKSRWDPFPWITYVESGGLADSVGLRIGDCLLNVDGIDLVGLKLADVAMLIHNEEGDSYVDIAVWRCPPQKETQDEAQVGLALKGPLPDITKNLVCALSGMVRALECPICLEAAAPPVWQCVHGHILCVTCRPKMRRCPICRVQLAQGRCLLADNLHRVLYETYFDANNSQMANKSVAPDHHNLCYQLFGKTKKQNEMFAVTKNNRKVLKPKQFLLARLLLKGKEKAASADNLTRVSEIGEEAAAVPHKATLADNLLRLSINDRAKSASTGELSKDNLRGQHIDSIMSSSQIAKSSRELHIRHTASQQSWSSLQMPVFSGSTDSVSETPMMCPFLRFCNVVVNSLHSLMEHIKSHQVPQIHYYSRKMTIPLPCPFGTNVFYILHHNGYMFFFQHVEESAWMTTTMACADNEVEWTLHGLSDNQSEVYLRRYVANLEPHDVTMSSHNVAWLPESLSLKVLYIHVTDHRTHDNYHV